MIHPGERFPDISIATVDGSPRQLPMDLGSDYTLLVVYRGLQCGVCEAYLREFSEQLDAFKALGVDIIAASAEGEDRVREARDAWTGARLNFGHSLDRDVGRTLRLFRSSARKATEPGEFFEPGLYLLDWEGRLLFVSIQNMPFGRPPVPVLLEWIRKIRDNGIPARGAVHY